MTPLRWSWGSPPPPMAPYGGKAWPIIFGVGGGQAFQNGVWTQTSEYAYAAGSALGITTQLDKDIAVNEALARGAETREAVKEAGGVGKWFYQGKPLSKAAQAAEEAPNLAGQIVSQGGGGRYGGLAGGTQAPPVSTFEVEEIAEHKVAEAAEALEPAEQAGNVFGRTMNSMLKWAGFGDTTVADVAETPEEVMELVEVMRNASVIPLAPPAPANEGFLAELDEAEEVVEDVADFVPTFVRQGAEWAERQTVMLSNFVGSQNLSSTLSGTGITPFDAEIFENITEEAPEAVEMMEMATVQLGDISLTGASIGLEAAGAVATGTEVMEMAELSAVQITDLMEEKMSEVASVLDTIDSGIPELTGAVDVAEMAVGMTEMAAVNLEMIAAQSAGLIAGMTSGLAMGVASEGIGILPWLGFWLLDYADKMEAYYNPTDEYTETDDPNKGAMGFANKFWDWGSTKGPAYINEKGYRQQDVTSMKVPWGETSLWLPVTLIRATDENYGVHYTTMDGKQGTSWVSVDDGVRWLTPFPKKSLANDEVAAFVPFVEMSDGTTYTIPPNSPTLLLEDMPALLAMDVSNKVYWVWFRDNGCGQLPTQRAPPANYKYITESLPNTKLWRNARVLAIQKGPGYWLFLATPQMMVDGQGFWFRVGLDGALLKDSEKTRNACVLQNLKAIRPDHWERMHADHILHPGKPIPGVAAPVLKNPEPHGAGSGDITLGMTHDELIAYYNTIYGPPPSKGFDDHGTAPIRWGDHVIYPAGTGPDVPEDSDPESDPESILDWHIEDDDLTVDEIFGDGWGDTTETTHEYDSDFDSFIDPPPDTTEHHRDPFVPLYEVGQKWNYVGQNAKFEITKQQKHKRGTYGYVLRKQGDRVQPETRYAKQDTITNWIDPFILTPYTPWPMADTAAKDDSPPPPVPTIEDLKHDIAALRDHMDRLPEATLYSDTDPLVLDEFYNIEYILPKNSFIQTDPTRAWLDNPDQPLRRRLPSTKKADITAIKTWIGDNITEWTSAQDIFDNLPRSLVRKLKAKNKGDSVKRYIRLLATDGVLEKRLVMECIITMATCVQKEDSRKSTAKIKWKFRGTVNVGLLRIDLKQN